MIPSELTGPDIAAFATLAGGWIGYAIIMDRIVSHRAGINFMMRSIRVTWMRQMMTRGMTRNGDAILIGHAIHSVTFFASTTVLVLAGLIGGFAALDAAHATVVKLEFVAAQSREMFQWKLLLLIATFTWALLQFTWSLRQCNYTIALMGSAPDETAAPERIEARAQVMARMLTLALGRFNAGMRAYYFALAIIAWFLSPWASVVMTVLIVAMLAHRQLASQAYRTLKEGVEP
jgi:uncharacterized membrane protein